MGMKRLASWLLVALSVLLPAVAAAGSEPAGGVSAGCAPRSAPSRGTYADLSSAPLGARVTVFGSGFGPAATVSLGGTQQVVVGSSDDCVTFIASGHGGELMVGAKPAGTLAIHAGRVLEARPSTLRSVWASARPGDVVYLRAGVYDSHFGEGDWCTDCTLETFKQGQPGRPIAMVGYPGEIAVLRVARGSSHAVISLGDQDSHHRRAAFLTFADLRIEGLGSCIYGGGNTSDPRGGAENTGAIDIRIVNVMCAITDARSNTMTGMIALQGNRWTILGNTFVDPRNRAVFNNNHGIYIQGGADDVEVAYNRFSGLHTGHVIQVHQDGRPFLYERIWIHDNLIEGAANTDMRGINVANVDEQSSVVIERNVFRNIGQDFSAVAVYRGRVVVRDNSFIAIRAPDILANGAYGGSREIIASGNRFETVHGFPAVAAEGGASMSDLHLSNNQYCGVRPQEREPQPCR